MNKNELMDGIKEVIISSLDLEDIKKEDIDEKAALFGDGLGLDSIDALELGMALKKKYNVSFKGAKEDNKAYFYSVESLANYIMDNQNK